MVLGIGERGVNLAEREVVRPEMQLLSAPAVGNLCRDEVDHLYRRTGDGRYATLIQGNVLVSRLCRDH